MDELIDFIEKEKARGSSNIGRYEVVKHKKWSLPVSVFILTIIAVAVSSIKRRGGMGINLGFWYIYHCNDLCVSLIKYLVFSQSNQILAH